MADPWVENKEFLRLVHNLSKASQHLCWLCTEHAGLSEPEDLEAVGDVQRALRALGVDVDPVDEEVSGE